MTHKIDKRITVWTLVITSLALFMVSLDNLVVTTALPVIRHSLHASLSQLEWTVNAYTLTFAVLLLTGAALGDASAGGASSSRGSCSSRVRRRSPRSRPRRACSTSRGRCRASAARS